MLGPAGLPGIPAVLQQMGHRRGPGRPGRRQSRRPGRRNGRRKQSRHQHADRGCDARRAEAPPTPREAPARIIAKLPDLQGEPQRHDHQRPPPAPTRHRDLHFTSAGAANPAPPPAGIKQPRKMSPVAVPDRLPPPAWQLTAGLPRPRNPRSHKTACKARTDRIGIRDGRDWYPAQRRQPDTPDSSERLAMPSEYLGLAPAAPVVGKRAANLCPADRAAGLCD